MRIAIIGTSGSGKTSLAKRLSEKLELTHYELDSLFWKANWIERSKEEFIEQVRQTISGENWIICGNYRAARELLWSDVNCIVWLDLPLYVCLWRGLKRTLKRIRRKEKCCGENVEKVRMQFFSKQSIFLWILKTYWIRKREYGKIYREGCYPIVRLKSTKEVDAWVNGFRGWISEPAPL